MTTRWMTLLGCCLLVAVAACGDDGGNNNGNDTCGDGQKTGSEQCDDGNVMGGDGCSATCRNESSGPVCGDGVMSGAEECDDSNTTSGDGCSATCMDENGPNRDCGNGMIDGTEACDDNNGTANDGCTACAVDTGYTCDDSEPSVCTPVVTANGTCSAPFTVTLAANTMGDLEGHAMGDTTGGMNSSIEADCNGSMVGGGFDHTYKFTLATAADVEIFSEAKPAFDMAFRLSKEACSVPMQVADDAGTDGCSDDDPEYLYYVRLPAGTYYLTVDGYDDEEFGAYDISIIAYATSTCGDGVVDAGEECDDMDTDDADGCSGRCDVETGYVCEEADDESPSVCELSCGDGVFESTLEECEPTADNMDICNANCTLVSDVTEVEPNDTAAQAQVVTEADHRIRGSLSSASDVDLYKFTLTQPAFVEFETYNASDEDADNYGGEGFVPTFDCYYSANTQLALFDATADVTMNAMALATDDDDGDVNCSYIGGFEGLLEPGTYIIKVTGSAAQSRYILDMFITPSEAPAAGDLVVNEVMANDNTADTNCDSTSAGENDEFVEIVNVSDKFLTINGMRLNDSSALRHTFAPGPTGFVGMLPGESVVVWAGGAPACTDVASWFTASTGGLELGNSGDTVKILPTGTGTTPVASMTYTATQGGVQAVSINLNPDLTGTTYARHNLVTGAVGNFSPGTAVDGTFFVLPE